MKKIFNETLILRELERLMPAKTVLLLKNLKQTGVLSVMKVNDPDRPATTFICFLPYRPVRTAIAA